MPARPTAPPSRLGAELLLDALYRVLGVLIGWRRGLLVGGALGGFALWLALVYQAAAADEPGAWLPAVLVPALLVFAGRRWLDLPPGVVFRPAPAAAGAPEPTARCWASGLFLTARGPVWRLLARGGLYWLPDGSPRVVSPPPLGHGAAAERAFPARDPFRPSPVPIAAEWLLVPQALDPARWRASYESPAAYAAATGELCIPRAALFGCTPGWQYAHLRRWPAVRLEYRDAPDAVAVAYLAFAREGQLAWALRRLLAS